MRYKWLETSLAQTLAWIWLVILVTAVVGYAVFRWWRKRHPLPVPKPAPSYAQQLQRRLNEHRGAGKPSKRSKPPRKQPRGP